MGAVTAKKTKERAEGGTWAWPLCECGCGGPVPAAQRSSTKRGVRAGEPLRFIAGHWSRSQQHTVDTLSQHFWERVRRAGQEECWPWSGAINSKGYGTIYAHGRIATAHRIAWELTYGPAQAGEAVRQRCGNRMCVNPKHLFMGPAQRRCRSSTERFWEKVNKTEGCWLWQGCRDKKGYGHFRVADGVYMLAHRFAYQELVRTLEVSESLCHNCPGGDNPRCVNPAHMFVGSVDDNNKDAAKKGRVSQGEKHYRAVLTKEDVATIKRLYVPRVFGYHRIAALLGVAPTTVRGVVKGSTWKRAS